MIIFTANMGLSLSFFLSAIVGYLFFLYLTHPEKKKHKLPKIRLWNIELSPNVRIHLGKKTYWFHHWFVLAFIIALPVFIQEQLQYPSILKGFVIGGILQGLRYPDRFKFRHPRIDHKKEKLKCSFKEQVHLQTSEVEK